MSLVGLFIVFYEWGKFEDSCGYVKIFSKVVGIVFVKISYKFGKFLGE